MARKGDGNVHLTTLIQSAAVEKVNSVGTSYNKFSPEENLIEQTNASII